MHARIKDEARPLGGDALLPITLTPAIGGTTPVAPAGTVLAGGSEIRVVLVIVRIESATSAGHQLHPAVVPR